MHCKKMEDCLLTQLQPGACDRWCTDSVMARVQMVSLLHLAKITEEGVQFASPVDGSMMMLTPEHSMAVQNRLGVPSTCTCA